MKAVLLPIWPQYCELIASGKKTVEVRKTRPKLETPFKCYIYCTACKSFYSIGSIRYGEDELYRIPNGKIKYGTSVELMGYDDGEYGPDNFLNRKVIGEFVCDVVYQRDYAIHDFDTITLEELSEFSCVSEDELLKYGDLRPLYGWHISGLVIYDKPKELSEFYKKCETLPCEGCEHLKWMRVNADEYEYDCDCMERLPITRPPQSWCYVEEVSE